MALDQPQLETACVAGTSFANAAAVRAAYAAYLATRPRTPVSYEQYMSVATHAVGAGA